MLGDRSFLGDDGVYRDRSDSLCVVACASELKRYYLGRETSCGGLHVFCTTLGLNRSLGVPTIYLDCL